MNEFNKLYNELCKSDYNELNKAIKTKNIATTVFIISFVIGFLSIYLSVNEVIEIQGTFFLLAVIFFIVSFIILIVTTNKTEKLIESDYYNNIIYKIVTTLFPNSTYSYYSGLPEHIYRKCNYLTSYNIYKRESLVNTNINNENLMFSEIETIEETTDSEGNTSRYTTFAGAAAYLKCMPNIESNIRITTDLSFSGKAISRKKRVELDSNEFEKHFDVICDNKINAMQFLTSDVMDKFVNLLKEYKIPFEIYIERETGIFFKFHIQKFLDLKSSKNVLDFKTLKKHYDNIKYIKTVISFVREVTKSLEF